MTDLTGKKVVLDFGDHDREKVHGALFQTGDVGVVLRPARRQHNGWIVLMHEQAVLFFTDELKEYESVICKECRQRADSPTAGNGLQSIGCADDCGVRNCACQHRGRPIEPTPHAEAPSECST